MLPDPPSWAAQHGWWLCASRCRRNSSNSASASGPLRKHLDLLHFREFLQTRAPESFLIWASMSSIFCQGEIVFWQKWPSSHLITSFRIFHGNCRSRNVEHKNGKEKTSIPPKKHNTNPSELEILLL